MSINQQTSPQKNQSKSVLDDIFDLVSTDMAAVDETIRSELYSEVELVNQIGQYLVNSGGKRLRPILVLLSAQAHRYTGQQHITMATVIEFIHTATLLHDDVVDHSEMRRGSPTANAQWGNEASVLVGDFIYSRAFELMVAVGNMPIMDLMSRTTNAIAEGEVLQLVHCRNPETTTENYMAVIERKTARLFQAASHLGAILGNANEAEQKNMANFGHHLGLAYQLIDDALDYTASDKDLGKNIGDDLAEGKPTLPLIYALENGTAEQKSLLHEAILNGGREHIDAVLDAVESTGAIEHTSNLAKQEVANAIASLNHLPASPYKDALAQLVEFAVSRTY